MVTVHDVDYYTMTKMMMLQMTMILNDDDYDYDYMISKNADKILVRYVSGIFTLH